MQRSEVRQSTVIYLTVSMSFGVRSLCSVLIVWLATYAAVPPCCWSMSEAYGHPAQQAEHAARAHDHHHHHDGDAPAVQTTATANVSPTALPGCDTATIDAVVTTRDSLSLADTIGNRVFFDTAVPHARPAWTNRCAFAPPGGTSGFAFLNPLRI